jgi:two-component system, OmpR family, sensor kinase
MSEVTAGQGQPGGRGSGPAAAARRWLAARTLRGRLITGVVALLALACAAVGVTTYIGLRGFLISQLDGQLTAASQRYTDCLNHRPPGDDGGERGPTAARPPPNSPQNCAQRQAGRTFIAQITGGSVGYHYLADGQCSLSGADRAVLTALPRPGRPFTSTLSNLGSYRLVAQPGEGGTGEVYVTGLPMEPVEATLRKVEIVEITVFSAALLLTGVLGTGWVRLSLRPLRRVAATATRVTQLPLASGEVALAERVPDVDPRTEIGQVGAAFNRMLGHVESALGRRAASEARLRRFAADASHELRTPLAAIRGYAELARRHPGPVPPQVAHALARVESESARMSLLVDELLLLAQLDAGRPLARDPVDLSRLAIDATSDARAASQDHQWRLNLPGEPVMVRGDRHRLTQVLANLMSNAARHTPPGTTVTVAIAGGAPPPPAPLTGAPDGGRPPAAAPPAPAAPIELSVTDDGPGIPDDLQPALFERFVRGDSARSHGTGSTGLGLAIVQAVITAHGGSVSVASGPGKTRFAIRLPRLLDSEPPHT